MELALKLIREAKEQRLTRLDLGNCGLTELPDELFELTWLEELILCEEWWEYSLAEKEEEWIFSQNNGEANNIKSINPKIKALRGLKKLFIKNHKELSDLTPLKDLTQLQQLDVASTQVSDLTPLKNLTQLQWLYVASTQISDLTPLKNLTQLQLLNVYSTQVSDLTPLKDLTPLQQLFIHSTQVSDLTPLKDLTQLQRLNVDETQVSDLTPLKDLTQLQWLNVDETQVSDLTPLKDLTQLQWLYVANTQVSDLTPLKKIIEQGIAVKWSTYEDGINVKDCPLINPPKEIVEQGNEAILSYWKQIEEQGGLEEINESKLIIVGEGGTGKTTLFEKLKDPNHNPLKNPTPETHGINILEGLLMQDGFRANLWDFGGQELQYMTHQFFLTPRALYVLMMDARKESPNLSYWFKIISLLGRESDNDKAQVLLVFNKRKGSTGTPQYEDLLSHYKDDFDCKFLEVDFVENDYNWDYLKKEIESRLLKLAIQLPKQWQPIREDLRKESVKNPHISTQRFSEICSVNKVSNEDDQWVGSAALHKLGQILHFQDEKGLRSRIILSPKWAVNGVYTFLENETIKQNCGRFSESEFLKILAKKEYKRADGDLILLLMTRNHFDICYKSKDGNYVAAQLLPDNKPPQYRWHPEVSKSGALQFSYQYPTMPKGLISRLIVRLSEYIERIEGIEVVWKKGAILCIDKDGQTCRVLIQEDNAESKSSLRQIKIEVMGELSYRKFALQKVRDEIEDLHKKWFRNIQFDEIVPCCCEKCRIAETPKSYLLKDLLELWQEDTIKQCTTGKKVEIKHLLEGVYETIEIENLFYDGRIMPYQLSKILRNYKVHSLQDFDIRFKLNDSKAFLQQGSIAKKTTLKVENKKQSEKKTLKIFLASSNELESERKAFELHFGARKRKTFAYDLEVVLWEDFIDAMSPTRLQDEYNKALKECDIFVMLFFSKVGMYTGEEFEKAFGHFKENGKPLIYTYFKDSNLNTANINRLDLLSLLDFQDKLKELGHFSMHYKGENDLNFQFSNQLDKLLKENRI